MTYLNQIENPSQIYAHPSHNIYDSKAELLLALRSFGLNPDDWNLSEIERDVYLIQNAEDNEFCFLGWTKKNRWTQVQLLEI